MINITIDEVMKAIGSGGGRWHLKAALVYCGKVAGEKMVSSSSGGGGW
jgi:hypothetical protein